jgi:hypothetical protein
MERNIMTSKEDSYSHITVVGEVIMTVIKSIESDALCEILLARNGLKNVRAGELYPMTKWAGLLFDLERKMPTVCKKAGELIVSTVPLPPHIAGFEQMLAMHNKAYYMNHIGAREGEIGFFKWEKKAEKEFSCVSNVPYPCSYDMGIIIGFAGRFNLTATVEHANDACRSKGDPQCNYRVRLK